MADFFNEIKLIKVLKKDELNALLVLAQKGDIEARNKVIKHNLRLLLNNPEELTLKLELKTQD